MSDLMPLADPVDDADMETAAENPPERRRGRPRVTDEFWEMAMMQTGDALRFSRRTIVNHYYRQRAFCVLDDAEGQHFDWLIGADDDDPRKIKSEILVELGRLWDKNSIREAATEICKREMKTKEAVALLRRYRIGTPAPGGFVALAREIEKAIDAYMTLHPGLTTDQVRAALNLVGLNFVEDESESGDDDDLPDNEE